MRGGLITSHMAPLIKTVSLLLPACLCCLGSRLLDCRVRIRKIPQGRTNEEEEEGGRETAVCALIPTDSVALAVGYVQTTT